MPHTLVRQEVEVRLTATTVEVLHHGKRVAAHRRSHARGRFTTDPGHRPKAHQRHLEWTPSRLVRWAASIGPHTGQAVQQILEALPHPEQGYRSCLGLMGLARRYGPDRLNAACERALRSATVRYRSVKSILEHGLDRVDAESATRLALPPTHAHLRGATYYATLTPSAGVHDALPTNA